MGYVDKVGLSYTDRLGTCIEVANAASEMGVSMSLAISVAYQESRFNAGLKSKVGAVGPLQIIPAYFCPKRRMKNCDLIRSGLNALIVWMTRSKTVREALCHYNSGNRCTKSSRAYARSVLRRQHRYRVMMRHASWDFAQDDM